MIAVITLEVSVESQLAFVNCFVFAMKSRSEEEAETGGKEAITKNFN